ncbi:MAG: orotate phosphoribosyltransferase [Candidatus Aenigmarchaeota archaeon]|nr:orotate phosphoribosyltransferase [Candidatus Aenigmarchaeota archaeon]
MAVGGTCMRCGNYSIALFTCKACGSRCCPRCVDARAGVCMLCGGVRKQRV